MIQKLRLLRALETKECCVYSSEVERNHNFQLQPQAFCLIKTSATFNLTQLEHLLITLRKRNYVTRLGKLYS
jgi:hypothetical protein